jgi:hypothetical protein
MIDAGAAYFTISTNISLNFTQHKISFFKTGQRYEEFFFKVLHMLTFFLNKKNMDMITFFSHNKKRKARDEFLAKSKKKKNRTQSGRLSSKYLITHATNVTITNTSQGTYRIGDIKKLIITTTITVGVGTLLPLQK